MKIIWNCGCSTSLIYFSGFTLQRSKTFCSSIHHEHNPFTNVKNITGQPYSEYQEKIMNKFMFKKQLQEMLK